MKKVLTTILILFSLSAFAQKDTTKPLVIQGNIQAFQSLINALDKSDAPHKEVEALKIWIIAQLNEQLKPKKP